MTYMSFEQTIYIITNGFRVAIMLRYAHCIYKCKKKYDLFEYSAYLCYWIINSAIYLLIHNTILNLLTNIIPMYFLSYFCNAKITTRVLATGGIYAVSMVFDCVLYALMKALSLDSIFITSGAGATLLLFTSVLLFENIRKNKQSVELHTPHALLILTIPIGSILIGMLTMQADQFKAMPKYIVIECFLLLLMNTMVLVVYDLICRTYQHSVEKIVLEKQNQAYFQQLLIMEKTQKQVSFLRHDMKNHLLQLHEFAQHREYNKILCYIEEAIASTIPHGAFVESGNSSIDSVLNLKLNEAADIGAEIHTEIKLPNELYTSPFDMNIILGNLLDNSIKAMSYTKRRVLYVKIEYDAGVLCIVVRNTYGIEQKQQHLDSNIPHGIGLQSIQTIVEKYNGEIQSFQKENVYSTKILLFI